MNCKYCGGKTIIRGHKKANTIAKVQCRRCGKYSLEPSRHRRSANILLLDIETIYLEGRFWSNKRVDYIPPEMITKDWSLICWSAKWLFEKEIMGEVVTPNEIKERRERSILDGIWKLMDKADIIITHNGLNFDIRRLNAKFLEYGYSRPSSFQNIDTMLAAKRMFHFTSYGLDFLAKKLLGLSGKTKMVIDDWNACNAGDKDALDKMLAYCKRDVAPLLEDVYLKLLPWIPNHPNLGIYADHDKDVCPNCESDNLSWNAQYATPQGLWRGFRCNTCGAIGRGTTKDYKEKKIAIKPV